MEALRARAEVHFQEHQRAQAMGDMDLVTAAAEGDSPRRGPGDELSEVSSQYWRPRYERIGRWN
jgi:hypothetical protein